MARARDTASLFTLPAGAGCVPEQAAHVEHDEHEHEHQDVNLRYAWRCSQPNALNQLDAAGLFKAFPSFSRLELQGILPAGQVAATLTPEQPRASW